MNHTYFIVGDKRETTPQLWSTDAGGYIWPHSSDFQAWVASGHRPTAVPDHAALQVELAHRAVLAKEALRPRL